MLLFLRETTLCFCPVWSQARHPATSHAYSSSQTLFLWIFFSCRLPLDYSQEYCCCTMHIPHFLGMCVLWAPAKCADKYSKLSSVYYSIYSADIHFSSVLLCFLPKFAAAAAESLHSCPTLCDPIDSSPPGSPVPGILQARTLEWVAISFFNA